jgi:two-component system, LytTR family, response regulator
MITFVKIIQFITPKKTMTKMQLHTILIDDDPLTLDTTELELKMYCPDDICIIRKCVHAPDGLQAIRDLKPDLVILDVEMPCYTGIQIVEILRGEGQLDFDVIFTTAHEEFSVKAFDLNALHYLLKPYHPDQLKEAIKRAITKRSVPKNGVTLEQVHALIRQSNKSKKLRISTREGIEFFPIDDILFVQADGGYAVIYLLNGNKRIVSYPLKDVENQLLTLTTSFKRTHQSYLVNIDFLTSFKPNGTIVLRGYDGEIPVSRQFKSGLSASLSQ